MRGVRMKELKVVAAIIEYKKKILCMQRNISKYPYTSLKYEFPGGKVEPGETNTEALERELREEMNIDVHISDDDYFMTIHHVYPDFAIVMHSYRVEVDAPDFVRKEHINHVWISPNEMLNLDWAAADVPIVKRIIEINNN